MKAMVGSSILNTSFEAGVEVAQISSKGLKTPKIGFLFSSVKYNQEELLRGIKSVNPELKIIGCTSSSGVMTPDGIISSEEGFAGMMVIEDNELNVGIASAPRGLNPRVTGSKIAREAMANAGKNHPPVAFAMFATPNEEEDYLKGIQDVIGELPMFGGSAADDYIVGEWKIMCGEHATDDGCAVALFYTTKNIKTLLTANYEETDNVGVITSVDDNRKIMEIDHVPALKKYAEWTGYNADDLMGQNLLVNSISMPLAVKTLQGEMTLLRHPKIGNPDYSLMVGANIAEKTAIIQVSSDIDGLIGGTVQAIMELKGKDRPAGLLLIHSSARKTLIGDRLDEDFVAIKNAVGDLPFIVPFTSAEFGHQDHSGGYISNLSLSFTSFSE